MLASYELRFTMGNGVHLQKLDNIIWMQASRTVNRIGHLSLRVPWTFDDKLLKADRMIQIWRRAPGGSWKLFRPYLIRAWRFETGSTGQEFVYIKGVDPNDLLRRRIVAHYAGSTNATASAEEADDLMKRIVTDAIADGSNPAPTAGTRVWSHFTVAGDLTAGPQLTKDFSWQPLLTTSGGGILSSLAEAAKEAGTEVWFDVEVNSVSPAAISFEFRTYTGQPGQDLTEKVRLDKNRTLLNPYLEYDYTETENYVYAGGRGLEDDREIQQVYDADFYQISPWSRCEGFEYATNQEAANGVREAGRARLRAYRPTRKFGADIMEDAQTRFGLHWNWGDKVRARYRDQEFDAIIKSVVLYVSDGSESISARLEYED